MSENSSANKPLKFMIAAGGTGGHFFPALALADCLKAQGHDILILTDDRGLRYKSDTEHAIETITSGTIRPGLWSKVKTLASLGKGTLQSARKIKAFQPNAVIGFGGYPTFPPMIAAQLKGIPTILHEANGVLGKANAMLAGRATKIALSLPNTKGAPKNDKSIVTGNPVRDAVITQKNATYPELTNDSTFRLFIMGGSQGARIFSDIIPTACALLNEETKRRLMIVQQCRPEDLDRTEKTYTDLDIDHILSPFFKDAPEQLAACHLFIGRSGASTVSDVTIVGRPALFIPMNHADMQQKHNADIVANANGGWIIMQEDFTPDTLAKQLQEIMDAPEVLKQAAHESAKLGQPKAAQNLAQLVIQTAR